MRPFTAQREEFPRFLFRTVCEIYLFTARRRGSSRCSKLHSSSTICSTDSQLGWADSSTGKCNQRLWCVIGNQQNQDAYLWRLSRSQHARYRNISLRCANGRRKDFGFFAFCAPSCRENRKTPYHLHHTVSVNHRANRTGIPQCPRSRRRRQRGSSRTLFERGSG